MLYKLTVIETNISTFSSKIIYDNIVECLHNIDDLRDYLIIDYMEKLNFKPVINVSKLSDLGELIIQVFCTNQKYDQARILEVFENWVMSIKDYKITIMLT
jgi:hypothetical protein